MKDFYRFGGVPPLEAVEADLCREVYHCPPSELDGEDYERLMAHARALYDPQGADPLARLEVSLCRDLYHCKPSELDEQDWSRVYGHLLALDVKRRVAKDRQRQMEWFSKMGYRPGYVN